MEAERRALIKCMLAFGAVGSVCAKSVGQAVYFNFFASSVRLDRYLRTMYDLVGIKKVVTPSFQGERSLEMRFQFSEKYRKGRLNWDLALVRFDRFRVRIWNPNSREMPIYLNALIEDISGCAWRIKYDKGSPLPASDETGWIVFEGSLDDAVCLRGNPDGRPHSILHLSLVFSVRKDFDAFGRPLKIYLDGLECHG